MGYSHCVLFDCARDALKAWPHGIALPGNVCRSVYEARPDAMLEEVDQATGLAKYCPVHLYGYQSPAGDDFKLALDPLMTGWVRTLKTESAIISFGRKKMLSLGYGGAFLTHDEALADEMAMHAYWNDDFSDMLRAHLPLLKEWRLECFETIELWDRYLGDTLIRIPEEQLMPWRVMRRAKSRLERDAIVVELRGNGVDVGTNFPPLEGSNQWGDTVLNFFCNVERTEIRRAVQHIKRVVHG